MPEIWSVNKNGGLTSHLIVKSSEVDSQLYKLNEKYPDRVFVIGSNIVCRKIVGDQIKPHYA